MSDICCKTCVHNKVCKHRDCVDKVINEIDKICISTGENKIMRIQDISFLKTNITCTYFNLESSVNFRKE